MRIASAKCAIVARIMPLGEERPAMKPSQLNAAPAQHQCATIIGKQMSFWARVDDNARGAK